MAVFDDVVGVISKTLKGVDVSTVTMETRFEQDLSADSLDLVELIMELEENYDMTIPDEDAQSMLSVGDAVKYIEKRVAEDV